MLILIAKQGERQDQDRLNTISQFMNGLFVLVTDFDCESGLLKLRNQSYRAPLEEGVGKPFLKGSKSFTILEIAAKQLFNIIIQ